MQQRSAIVGLSWVFLCIGLARTPLASIGAAEADPRVKPGEKFTLSFPNLPKDRKGNTSEMEVSIPKSHDPNKTYPLLVWLGGGDGSSASGSGNGLADADKFILAGMPYPKGANNPGQSNMVGNFPVIWAYHRTMLEELHRVVPNINTDLRILAGFSNGGHCIDGYMKGARQYFNTFVLADGGGRDAAAYPPSRGCHVFVCWGSQSPAKSFVPSVAKKAARAGMKVVAVEMKGEGHEFPEEYQQKVREWIQSVVIPEVAEAALSRAKTAAASRPAEALASARGLQVLLGEKEEKTKAELERIIERVQTAARKEFEEIKTALGEDDKATPNKAVAQRLKSFAAKYRGTKEADEAAQLIESPGKKEKDAKKDPTPAE